MRKPFFHTAWLWPVVVVLAGCMSSPQRRTAFSTPDSPLIAPEASWPASAEFELIGPAQATACASLAELRKLSGGDYAPTAAGHPFLVQQAKYEAIELAGNADNLLAIRTKTIVSDGRECVTVSGRAYRLQSLKLAPPQGGGGASATLGSLSGAAPAAPSRGRALRLHTTPNAEPATAGHFGWALEAQIPYQDGHFLTTWFSIPVGPTMKLGPFDHHFAVAAGATLVTRQGQVTEPEDLIPRVGANWMVWLMPNLAVFGRPHIDYHLNGYAGTTYCGYGYGSGYGYTKSFSCTDRSNEGFGFGVDAGAVYKVGGLALLAELGTQHVGIGVGAGF